MRLCGPVCGMSLTTSITSTTSFPFNASVTLPNARWLDAAMSDPRCLSFGRRDGAGITVARVLVYPLADGFSALPLELKVLAWHLYRAALAGLDALARDDLRQPPHVGLVVERAPEGLKRELGAWGLSDSSALLMKRLKEQLDPSDTFSPGLFG